MGFPLWEKRPTSGPFVRGLNGLLIGVLQPVVVVVRVHPPLRQPQDAGRLQGYDALHPVVGRLLVPAPARGPVVDHVTVVLGQVREPEVASRADRLRQCPRRGAPGGRRTSSGEAREDAGAPDAPRPSTSSRRVPPTPPRVPGLGWARSASWAPSRPRWPRAPRAPRRGRTLPPHRPPGLCEGLPRPLPRVAAPAPARFGDPSGGPTRIGRPQVRAGPYPTPSPASRVLAPRDKPPPSVPDRTPACRAPFPRVRVLPPRAERPPPRPGPWGVLVRSPDFRRWLTGPGRRSRRDPAGGSWGAAGARGMDAGVGARVAGRRGAATGRAQSRSQASPRPFGAGHCSVTARGGCGLDAPPRRHRISRDPSRPRPPRPSAPTAPPPPRTEEGGPALYGRPAPARESGPRVQLGRGRQGRAPVGSPPAAGPPGPRAPGLRGECAQDLRPVGPCSEQVETGLGPLGPWAEPQTSRVSAGPRALCLAGGAQRRGYVHGVLVYAAPAAAPRPTCAPAVAPVTVIAPTPVPATATSLRPAGEG